MEGAGGKVRQVRRWIKQPCVRPDLVERDRLFQLGSEVNSRSNLERSLSHTSQNSDFEAMYSAVVSFSALSQMYSKTLPTSWSAE
jgi:hypothetical protein